MATIDAGDYLGRSTNIEVNTFDGSFVGDSFSVYKGNVVNILGGTIGDDFRAYDGAEVNISGGSVGNFYQAHSGSLINLSGGIIRDVSSTAGIFNITGGSVGKSFVAESGSVINLSGGSIGNDFDAGNSDGKSSNVVVNVSGGTIGTGFDAYHGSTINVSGGTIGTSVDAFSGSKFNISGGLFSGDILAKGGAEINVAGGTMQYITDSRSGSNSNYIKISGGRILGVYGDLTHTWTTLSGGAVDGINGNVHIKGSNFRFNGVPIVGLDEIGESKSVSFPHASGIFELLSGVLSDGTPFLYAHNLNAGGDTLTQFTLEVAPVAQGPPLISVPNDQVPLGVGAGQTLILNSGAVLPDRYKIGYGATVNLLPGGSIGEYAQAVGAVVNVTGGSIGNHFRLFADTVLNISGGSVGTIEAYSGSNLNISGGSIGNLVDYYGLRTVNISGGLLPDNIDLHTSTVTVSGGRFGQEFGMGSVAKIIGREFRLNGTQIEGLDAPGNSATNFVVPNEGILSGVLSDGTPFAFSQLDGDRFPYDLTLQASDLPPIGPAEIVASRDQVPGGIREGQTLVVDSGSVIGSNFSAGWGSAVEVHNGGTIGANFEAVGANVWINGGSIADNFDAMSQSVVTMTEGSIPSHRFCNC